MPDARPAQTAPHPSARAAWLGLAVLGLLMLASTINTAIVYLNVAGLKASLGLSDAQVGALSGLALTLVSAVAVLPLGWLADRVNRLHLLAACVAIWSAATVGFAMAQSFESLFGFAMGIAIGEAVLGPIIYSLIPDMFPREKWVQANLAMYVMGRLGGAAGLAAAGLLVGFATSNAGALPAGLSGLEPWRIAMLLSTVAAPLLILFTLMIRVRRARAVAAPDTTRSDGLLAYFIANRRAIAGVFLGFGVVFASSNGTSVWFPAALERQFGATPAEIGVTLGGVSAVSAALGIGVAFLMARWLRPRFGDVTPMVLAQIATLVILLTTPLLLVVDSLNAAYAVLGLKNLALTVCLSLSPAVLQVLAPGFLRGRVIAIGGAVSVAIMSVAPLAVGALSDHVFTGPHALMSAIVALSSGAGLVALALLRFGGSALPATIAAAAEADAAAEAAAPASPA